MKGFLGPARRNAVASYINFGTLAVIGVFVNPLLLAAVGPSAFGVWRSCQKMLDFATVADGRASQALKWIVAHSQASDEERQTDVGSAVFVWLLWVPVLLVVLSTIVIALPSLIGDRGQVPIGTIYVLGAVLSVNILFSGLLWIPDSVLVGTNQGFRSMSVTTVVAVLVNVGMVLSTKMGGGIGSLGLLVLMGSLVNATITLAVVRRRVSWFGFRRPRMADVAKLLGFSGWVLLWSFVTKLYLATELILFSVFIGAIGVTRYTFSAYVLTFALAICLMTTSALMPSLGSAIGRSDHARARDIALAAREITLGVACVAGVGVLTLNRPFVTAWVGDQYYLGDAVNLMMVVSFAQLAIIRSDAQIQDTGLKIRSKVLVGLGGAFSSAVIAGVTFVVTGNLVLMYVALVLSRLSVNVMFPRLVRRLVDGTAIVWHRYAASLLVLALAAAIQDLGGGWNLWIQAVVGVTATAASLPMVALLVWSAHTRRRVLRPPRVAEVRV